MEYGSMGEHLSQSLSEEVREMAEHCDSLLRDLAPEDLPDYVTETNLRALIEKTGSDFRGKNVVITGSGGASQAAEAAARSLGAGTIFRLTSTGRKGAVTCEEACEKYRGADILINTTPTGMFPLCEGSPADLDAFPSLSCVIDAVYNPLRTDLVLDARERGIPAEGGLYMLAAQAVREAERVTGRRCDQDLIPQIYGQVRTFRENIVLTGMPGSGKSAVGKLLAAATGRRLWDVDTEIVKTAGMEITEIFARYGETYFRDLETETIFRIAKESGVVISLGGGSILREENVRALRRNGRLYFLDRPLDLLVPTDDRPLGDTREKVAALYKVRMPIYLATADVKVEVRGSEEDAAGAVKEEFFSERTD